MPKTQNYSIRFNEEQLKLVLQIEKLTSPQKAVNFLFEKYWWEKRIKPEPTPSPSTQANQINKAQKSTLPPSELYDDYKTEILATTWSGDLQKIMKIINADSTLAGWKKKQLQSLADSHRLNFTN